MASRKGTANPRGNTAGQYNFSQIPKVGVPRSVFNRSCGNKTTFDAGYLVPIFCDEALPGDTFKMNATCFGRMATPIFPVMDNFYLDTFYFAVAVRLLWDNWEKFHGAQDNPTDSTDYLVPQITALVTPGSLSDYMGLPLSTTPNPISFSALWHRAYNLIFKEWFRDQNLTDSPVINTDDGPDDQLDYPIRKRAKRHDYFTSSLPFTQKGGPIELPLGGTAPVTGDIAIQGDGIPLFSVVGAAQNNIALRTGSPVTQNVEMDVDPAVQGRIFWQQTKLGLENATADLANATAATINDIRLAFQTQRLLEKDARGGTRYTEIIRSHFGVTSPDSRLQRPEYLGGSSTRINVHPVAQTNEGTNVPRELGSLAGYATMQDTASWMKSFTEHCVIIGLANVRADITYQQGIERQWSRRERFDFYYPSFAHLGEQAVLSQEIYADGTVSDQDVWGYQERYAEYRYKPSIVTGKFRSADPQPLDSWHLALDFASRPLLNDAFIQDDPPFDRVIAVTDEPHFIMDCYFDYRCARPMPTYSVPGLVDHF